MYISKKDLKILESNDWVMVCESPLEFERCTQFAGTHTLTTKEEIEEELEQIKSAKRYKNAMYEFRNKKEKEELEKDINELKKHVKSLLETGITEETLLQFYMASCWFGKKRSQEITSKDLKKWFKEVFDEVDPP
jgi:hypothetical protein